MDFIMNSKQFTESTTSGAIATVATPVGKTQTRGKGIYPNEKGGNLLTGKKTNEKFANSKSVKESQEQDVSEASNRLTIPDSPYTRKNFGSEKLVEILKSRGWQGPFQIQQLGKKWIKSLVGLQGIDTDDYAMVQGKDPEYDGWVVYAGNYVFGIEYGYHMGDANKVAKWTKDWNQDLSEAKLDEEDIIIVPGQGKKYKQGFIPKAKDRTDHEVEMALSDLFQSAKNAKQVYELIKDIPEEVGIEGWVQEKIIKANDYLNTIREYLEHKQVGEVNEMFADRDSGHSEKETKADREYVKRLKNRNMPNKSKPETKNKEQQGVAEGLADDFASMAKSMGMNAKIRQPGEKQPVKPAFKATPPSPEERIKLQQQLEQTKREINKLRQDKDESFSSRETWSGLLAQHDYISKRLKMESVDEDMAEGYRILPNIDREKYQERQGLEGPFRARNGKVYYYDPKAGLAYDPDTDFYIDYDTLTMMDREMSEGVIGKVLAGTALLASLWGIGQQQAQQVYSNSPQLQTLIKYHQMAAQQGDQAKIQELEKRIENHKTRLSLGKGEVMGADDKPIVPKYESSIMRGLQNEQTNDWGSMSKRDFKRREMEHELGHETRKTYNKPKGMFFYNVPAGKETDASRAGLKQSKSGKWYGYQDNMFGKGRYWEPKNESVTENTDKCPECGGKLVAESELNEEGNKDACYHKVKSRYKVWPSAYASGALVKCRKVGASNWGNKSK